jgi:alkaline phosphatase
MPAHGRMNRKVWWVWAATVLAVAGAMGVLMSFSDDAQAQGGQARNVILCIGDGMGDSEITIARNYELGVAGTLAMDTLPMTGDYTTYTVREEDPDTPDYVPDSAATATAWATGSKTSNGRKSTTAGTDEDLTTILELAQGSGRLTGNVTTASLTDASPAALMAKVADRGCEGPEETAEDCPQDSKAERGPGSIAEQSVDQGVDLLLGGGMEFYEQEIDGGPYEGSTVLESARDQGYRVIENADELEAAAPGERLLGLFGESTLETVWSGEPAKKDFDVNSEPQTCEEGVQPAEQPTLEAMTTKALELLDNLNGFFLQVEGASIDKEDHISNPCEQIGETVDFDNAIAVGLEYAEQNPDTLVVVTGDHGHTSQIIPGPASGYHDDDYDYNPPGESALLRTADDTDMLVTYATNVYRDENGEIIVGEDSEDSHVHTGTQIRIAAQGPLSERVLGKTDQTDPFFTMADAMSLDSSGATASAPAAMADTGGGGLEGFPVGGLLVGLSGAALLSGVLLLGWAFRWRV